MDNSSAMRVLSQLRRSNVPLQHSVQLICKVGGVPLGELASNCGYHRNYLYKSLKGDVTPAGEFRMSVLGRLGVDPWDYQISPEVSFDDSSDSIVEILQLLQAEGVPLQHSVSMLCKTKSIAVGKLAANLGFHRNHLFQALSGQRQPSIRLREGVEKQLGVDPWDYAPDLEASA